MTRPDTQPTPAPAQDVTARAAEALYRHRIIAASPPWVACACDRSFDGAVAYAEHHTEILADAGLLARDLPSREEIAWLLSNWLDAEPVDHPRRHLPLADAVLELLRGESRGE